MKRLGADGFIGTYEASGDFLVDVFNRSRVFEAWLYREDYGIKEFLFGLPVEQEDGKQTLTLESFLVVVENNLESYMESYISEHCQGELIPLGEWAKINGITPATARQRALRGCFKSAVKIGRNWLIAANEPLIDGRYKVDTTHE